MKRCLIADPSEIIRKIARHYLEQQGYEVHEAGSASDALAACRAHAYKALLLDWRLPGMTTVEFLSAVRFGDVKHKPLVIYTTLENDPAAISRAFAAGAHSYLLKPFDHA
ncbi:MAG: response regulator, partial [Hyphomicrobium sp.]